MDTSPQYNWSSPIALFGVGGVDVWVPYLIISPLDPPLFPDALKRARRVCVGKPPSAINSQLKEQNAEQGCRTRGEVQKRRFPLDVALVGL